MIDDPGHSQIGEILYFIDQHLAEELNLKKSKNIHNMINITDKKYYTYYH